jgi:hypothetical protein
MSREESPLWKTLARLPPREVGERAGVAVNDEGGFVVPLLTGFLTVSPQRSEVRDARDSGALVRGEEELLLLAYLIHARATPFTGRWVSATSLPGGELFYRGPHALPVHPLESAFGGAPSGLLRAGERLGGTRLSYGDASVELKVLPRVRAAPVVWGGDDEFPARATMLFDSCLAEWMPLDLVLALAHVVVRRLLEPA